MAKFQLKSDYHIFINQVPYTQINMLIEFMITHHEERTEYSVLITSSNSKL